MVLNLSPQEEISCFLYLHNGVAITSGNADYFIGFLEKTRKDWPRRDFRDRDVLSDAYKTLAAAYACKKDYIKAAAVTEDGIVEINKLSEHSYKNLETLHQMAGHYYVFLGDENKALSHFRHFVYYCCISHTHYNVREFYSFRSVSKHSLEDLHESKITLGTPESFNDVVDSLIYPWMLAQAQEVATKEEEKEAELLMQAWSYARIRCFAYNKPLPTVDNPSPKPYSDREEFSNTLMWSHYTDNHKGFCARYQFPSKLTHEDLDHKRVLTMGEVNYVDFASMNTSAITLQKAFFTKSIDWEYEHEKRLLYYDVDSKESHIGVPIPEDSLTDIYFGVRCSDEDKQRIIHALDGKSVKYHQMVIDLNDVYRLLAKDYNSATHRLVTSASIEISDCNPKLGCIKKVIKSLLCNKKNK